VLFSNPSVQDLIRSNFVAAWESVRPVPRVSIDFGNGRKLERTLNGNVATYVCDPQGFVVDVIPGVCDPATYVSRLEEALDLYARRTEFGPLDTVVQHSRLAARARTDPASRMARAAAAQNGPSAPNTRSAPGAPSASNARNTPTASQSAQTEAQFYGKFAVEMPLKTALGIEKEPTPAPDPVLDRGKRVLERPMKRALGVDQELLAADAHLNRLWRDPAVHELLARGVVRPADITKALYRDVLHVDLDDPYLGLAGGPFDGGAYGGLDAR
jgi:hypothetical protein